MSAEVKLSPKLAGDPENNGVDAWRERLVEHPERLMACFVLIDVADIRVITDTGKHIPTIRIRRIEPLGPADEISQAIRHLAEEAMETRTGKTPLPFDQVAAEADAVSVSGPLEEDEEDQDGEDGPWPGDDDYEEDQTNG